MATLVFLAGYLVYIACMIALWFLVLVAVFPSSMAKLSSIMIPTAFIFPLALKNFPWVVVIPGSSIASLVIPMLLCLTCYLACTLIGLAVLRVGLFVCRAALGKHRDEASVVIGCAAFVVMDMFMSYSSMVVNDTEGVIVLVEKPSFTSQLLLNLPFSIQATLLGPAAGYLAGVLATLLALWALSFLMAKGLSLIPAILLPVDTYPRMRFATVLGLTFMVMRYMTERSDLISGMKPTLLGLADLIKIYRLGVVYMVVRYVTFLALALLPQVTTRGKYNKAAVIISLGVVLTMRPGLSSPIEKPAALICESLSATAASTKGLDDFIKFSEQMMVEHKMALEKIVSEFNLLIEESKGEIKSFVVHTILLLMTLMGGAVFYVWDQYSVWMNTLTDKVPGWMMKRFQKKRGDPCA
jgi:hypothetical protein